MNRPAQNRPATAGFTLLELVVVMGILAGFLVMLVRFVDSGVTLFAQGESSQNLADRAMAATRQVRTALQQLRGPSMTLEPCADPQRLLVQWLPYGLFAGARPQDPHAQFLRADVHLDAATELPLQREVLRLRAETEVGDQGEAAVTERLQQLLAATPLLGRGGLWLFPWPQAEGDGSYLQLRLARFLPGQLLQRNDGQLVDPMKEPVPGSPELPAALVQHASTLLVEDLLHFELRFWGPDSTVWSRDTEVVWDSARAGWLTGGDGPGFRLDRGPESLQDATDDVFPRAMQVLLVVGRDPQQPPDGFLARQLAADDRVLLLLDGDRFEGPADGGFVKVGPEWIHYQAQSGDELRGLERGRRGTSVGVHPEGTKVRTGRTVQFTMPMPYGKDGWNG